MIQEKIKVKELAKPEMPKVNIGLRCHAELKRLLSQEAVDLGIHLSEYCETALLNRHDYKMGQGVVAEAYVRLKEVNQKNVRLKEEIRENEKLREQESILNSQLAVSISRNKVELEELKEENMMLKKVASETATQVNLLNDPVLLSILKQVKGKKDTVIMPDGSTFAITYNSPEDLLKAMIHSYKTK
ncbi:MAG: hypothetical protein M3Q58_12305 [Bacteroidota bacterium]|nr:hypothetical protein [Bacteroidota bacterium]